MNRWDIKANFDFRIRQFLPFNFILKRERANVSTLLSKVELQDITILDIGCGTGSIPIEYHSKAQIVGFDVSQRMLQIYRNQFETSTVLGDARDLPFKSCCVDVVVCVGLLEYLADLVHMMKILSAPLKRNGFLLLTTTPLMPLSLLRFCYCTYLRFQRPRSVIEISKTCGLTLIEHLHSNIQDQFLFRKDISLSNSSQRSAPILR